MPSSLPPHPPATSTTHNDGHEVLRLTGGGGDDASSLDSDDEFRLQLPTPPQLAVDPPLAAEEADSDCTAATDAEDSDCAAAADDSDDKEMQIFVKGLQKTMCLQVMPDDTISTIEALVQNKECVPRSKFYLIFEDKKLEDGSRTLADLKITNLTTFEMVLMSDVECYDHY